MTLRPDTDTAPAPATGRGSVVGSSGSLPRVASRLSMRRADVVLVQRASGEIETLGADLDRRLQGESRPSERLRMIRETTNQITRVANDAIHAYGRASRAVRAEEQKPDSDQVAAREMRARLDEARSAVLSVLDVASKRYGSDTDPAAALPAASAEPETPDTP
jgi:hypothetical protein